MFKLAALLFITAYASAGSPFEGMTFEQKQKMMGTKLDGNSMFQLPVVDTVLSSIPSSFVSGKDKWQACDKTISFIKDQADCGSCWAVAASEVVADRTCIANVAQMEKDAALAAELNEPAPMVDMSAEDIMTCCSWCGSGCQGGYIADAMKYWEYDGVVTGGWYGSNCGCQPYQIKPCGPRGCNGEASTPRCSKRCRSGFGRSFSQDLHKATRAYSLSSRAAAIQSEIMTHGPVECGFTVYENFEHWTGPAPYTRTSGRQLGGHAVKIIGWGEYQGTPYWLINNSWNTTWGMNGQFRYLRGSNLGGMEAGCAAALPSTRESNFKLQC